MGTMATETGCSLDSGSRRAGAWKLPGQRMLSPERLALPDYEYLVIKSKPKCKVSFDIRGRWNTLLNEQDTKGPRKKHHRGVYRMFRELAALSAPSPFGQQLLCHGRGNRQLSCWASSGMCPLEVVPGNLAYTVFATFLRAL
ncbi:hypothetical protein ACRRTK_014111 [Alexandromys fortis]